MKGRPFGALRLILAATGNRRHDLIAASAWIGWCGLWVVVDLATGQPIAAGVQALLGTIWSGIALTIYATPREDNHQ